MLFGVLTLGAKPQFQLGKKYKIVCEQYTNGCTSIGSAHGKETPVYYLENGGSTDDCYWYINEEEPGRFSIRNASTGEYITYTGGRSDGIGAGNDIRYVGMTVTMDEDDALKSMWSFEQYSDNIYVIRNGSATTHIWDVRVSPSFVVGTYESNNITINQRFLIYDEDGVAVSEYAETVSGYNVSSWLVASTDVESSKWNNNGWTWHEGGAYYNEEASVVSPFYENWHASNQGPLADNSLTQTLYNLPAGSYTLTADMIAVLQGSVYYNGRMYRAGPATGVTLFVDNNTQDVSTYDGVPVHYTIEFTVGASGTITFGARAVNTTANWIAMDNIKLYYHATESELLAGELAKLRADAVGRWSSDQVEEKLIFMEEQTFENLEELRHQILAYPDGGPLAQCASDITIKGRTPIYVESLGMYLCSISEKHFGTNFTDTIAYTPINGYGTMRINGTPVADGATYTFANVEAQKTYSISFTNGSTTVTYPLTFTSLPVVRINGEFSNTYSNGYIVVAQPNKKKAELLDMKAKWRGGITNSNGKHKRNYHVKFLDDMGNKVDKRYFDLRKDNSWILESCQVDMGRIRNRVLTDLWNSYRHDPYYIDQEPEALTGSRGEFVELILNDDYRGIYCMTEAMDRKQMKLKKYDEETLDVHGQLWKSKDWSYATMMGTSPDGGYQPKYYLSDPNGDSEAWDSYNIKYPEIDEIYPVDWSTLYNAVDFVCHSSDEDFKAHIAEYFDLPVVIDYYILMETILATDNHGKNMYFAVYDKQVDKKITFGVWDMDATCGQRWSDQYYHASLLGPEQDYSQFISVSEHGDYNLFKRLRDTDAENFNSRVSARYHELRGNKFATDSILQRFQDYFTHFRIAGADQREYARWSYDSDVAGHVLNFETEYDYIDDWFTRRMNYLDTVRFPMTDIPGDVNGDTEVNFYDVRAVVNYILGKPQTGNFDFKAADVNNDNIITIADVTKLVNIVNGW